MASDPSISGQIYFVDQWRKIAYRLRVSSKSKLVILALIDQYARRIDGQNCFPAIETIAWDTNLSERTVQRCFDELGRAGVVFRIENPGTSNTYTFADPDTFAALMPERPPRKKRGRLSGTPDTMSPHPCQAVTPPPTTCHPTPVRLSPDPSDLTLPINTPREQGAAATHTREGERTHEASQPAAMGQDLDLDHEQPKQAAAASKPTVDDASSEASAELVQTLGTLLASRMASLVRKPDAVTPAMIRPALRTLKRWAAGDEGKVKEYLFDELDRQEGRESSDRARNPVVLLKWLADKKSWGMWQAAASVTGAVTPGRPIQRGGGGGRRHGSAFLFEPETAAIAAKIKRN
jgi:hypothetical protein